ncbi:helix-turn-helix domain-containing protein [Heliophilum fasciatum]|uniref:Helix-turn-helix protein n=1 Tax=Heliophilum fasciatum TaxID=35700 RepID=A0A4R2RIB3_9FIRM|nr:helix-turn-helix transcriptional regulator [Heliophilum fasciatum]MCW2278696.1 transcriptional regulator with XRE-family HTH domain [Heliophilum fasciatum]TCP62564.1 helix-turn-helix protein [Heliophilum fasciatum]
MNESREERIEKVSRNMDVGEYLKELRAQKELSLTRVGQDLKVSATYLSEIERGQKVPSDHLIRQMASYYAIDEDLLFSRFGKVPVAARRVLEDHPRLMKTLADIGRHDALPEDKKQDLYDYLDRLYESLGTRKKDS